MELTFDSNSPQAQLPPQNQEAENGLLGAILQQSIRLNEAIGRLDPADFYRQENGNIFKAMLALHRRNEPVDVITVSAELGDPAKERYLAYLQSVTPADPSVSAYAVIIANQATRRRLIATGSSISAMAYRQEDPVEELVNEAEAAVLTLQKNSVAGNLVTQDETTQRILDHLLNPGDGGLQTGYVDLDRLLGGLRPGRGYWFAAAEKVGKTSFLNGISLYNARAGKVVLRISAEESTDERTWRDVAQLTKLPIQYLMSDKLNPEDEQRIFEAVQLLNKLPILTDETKGIKPSQIRAAINKTIYKFGHIDLIEVDYYQRLGSDNGNRSVERSFQLEEISRAVHDIIGDARIRVPLIGTAQVVSKQIDNRRDKRPQISDIFGSSGLLKDAYALGYIYRDDYYNKETSERPNIAEVSISLNRGGPTGVIDLYWHGTSQSFRNLQRQEINLDTPSHYEEMVKTYKKNTNGHHKDLAQTAPIIL